MPFYLYFGLLGLVIGGVIVWLLNAAHPFETREEPWRPPDELEAGFLAHEMSERGRPLDEETVAELLELHSAYLDGRIREEQARTAALKIETARAELIARAGPDGSGPSAERTGVQTGPAASPAGLPEPDRRNDAAQSSLGPQP